MFLPHFHSSLLTPLLHTAVSTTLGQQRQALCKQAPMDEPRWTAGVLMRDKLIRRVSSCGDVSVTAVVGSQLVSEASRVHSLTPTSCAALGQALLGALLMNCLRGAQETAPDLKLVVKGRGQLGHILVETTASGLAVGCLDHPEVQLPLSTQGEQDVTTAIGPGTLEVVCVKNGFPIVDLYRLKGFSGNLSAALPALSSLLGTEEEEEKHSYLVLGEVVGSEPTQCRAGGYLLQARPTASPAALAQAQANMEASCSVSAMLRSGLDAEAMADRLLEGLGVSSTQSLEPRYGPCDRASVKARSVRQIVETESLQEVESLLSGCDLQVLHKPCMKSCWVTGEDICTMEPEATSKIIEAIKAKKERGKPWSW